jgi:hypothetical protein
VKILPTMRNYGDWFNYGIWFFTVYGDMQVMFGGSDD